MLSVFATACDRPAVPGNWAVAFMILLRSVDVDAVMVAGRRKWLPKSGTRFNIARYFCFSWSNKSFIRGDT